MSRPCSPLLMFIGMAITMLLVHCKEDEGVSPFDTPVITVLGDRAYCVRCSDFAKVVESNQDQIFVASNDAVSIFSYVEEELKLIQQLENLGRSGVWDIWADEEWLFVGFAESQGDGKVNVYVRDGETWTLHQVLAKGRKEDNFGGALDMQNGILVVGASAWWEDSYSEPNSDEGSVHIYELLEDQWEEKTEIYSDVRFPGDWFGASVAIQNELVFAGSFSAPLQVYRYKDEALELISIDLNNTATFLEHDGNHFLTGTATGVTNVILTFEPEPSGAYEYGGVELNEATKYEPDFCDVAADKAVALHVFGEFAYMLEYVNGRWRYAAKVYVPEKPAEFQIKGVEIMEDKLILAGRVSGFDYNGAIYVVDLD